VSFNTLVGELVGRCSPDVRNVCLLLGTNKKYGWPVGCPLAVSTIVGQGIMFVSYIVLNTNEVNTAVLNLLEYNMKSSSIVLTNTLIIIVSCKVSDLAYLRAGAQTPQLQFSSS